MRADRTLDCYGLLCPMPVVQTARELKSMKPGEVLEVLATDPGIVEDLPSWCRMTGQEFLGTEEDEGVIKSYVKKVKE